MGEAVASQLHLCCKEYVLNTRTVGVNVNGSYRGRYIDLTSGFLYGRRATFTTVEHKRTPSAIIFLLLRGFLQKSDLQLGNPNFEKNFRIILMDNDVFLNLHKTEFLSKKGFFLVERPGGYINFDNGFQLHSRVKLTSGEKVDPHVKERNRAFFERDVKAIIDPPMQQRILRTQYNGFFGIIIMPAQLFVRKNISKKMINSQEWIEQIDFSVDLAEKVESIHELKEQ